MTIGVATTTVSYKCNGREELAWLIEAEEMIEHAREAGHELKWFVALEQDDRGDEPFKPLIDELMDLEEQLDDFTFTIWRYQLDDNEEVITTHNRLIRISMGRNLAQDWATRQPEMTHLLFLDSDTTPEADAIPKLIELHQPVTGGWVPVYGSLMDGPAIVHQTIPALLGAHLGQAEPDVLEPERDALVRVARPRSTWADNEEGEALYQAEQDLVRLHPYEPVPEGWPIGADVKEHWNTAGFLLLERCVFTRIAWNYDPDSGNSDDPAFQRNCAEMFGHQTWVRHDVMGHHVPGAIGAEMSHSEESRRIAR